jgi:6-phosphogluconolactonase (cycloisomerase 2 family)
MEGISQLLSNENDTMLYVLAKNSKNVVSFSVDGFGRPLFLENSSLGEYAPARMALSPSEEHLAIVSDMNDSLLLCAIP